MPKRTWFSMAAKDAGKTADIAIYDIVGYWGVDAGAFRDALAELGDIDTINLRINSPGGDVYAGVTIHNMLARHPANVIVTVDGLAASIASLIAMSGNEIVMPENSAMLIHNPSGGVWGTADDMDDMAGWLRQIGQGVTNTYVSANRVNLPRDQIEAMLSAETWMTAQEAVDKGFADKVTDPRDITAKFDADRFGWQKAPQALVTKPAAEPEWTVNAADNITAYRLDAVADFDASKAGAAILAAVPDATKAVAGFLVFDRAAPTATASFGLPIATVVDGKLRVTAEALDAVEASLPDATFLSEGAMTSAKAALADHRRALALVKSNAPAAAPPPPADQVAAAALATRNTEILAACELAGVTAKQAREFIDGGKSLNEVRGVLQALAAGAGGSGGRGGEINSHNPGGTRVDASQATAGWQKQIDRHNASRMQHAPRRHA